MTGKRFSQTARARLYRLPSSQLQTFEPLVTEGGRISTHADTVRQPITTVTSHISKAL